MTVIRTFARQSLIPFLLTFFIFYSNTRNSYKSRKKIHRANALRLIFRHACISVPSRNVTAIPILNFLPIPCYDKNIVHLSPTCSEPCPSSKTRLLLTAHLCLILPYYATSTLSDNSDALSARSAETGIVRRIGAYLEGEFEWLRCFSFAAAAGRQGWHIRGTGGHNRA